MTTNRPRRWRQRQEARILRTTTVALAATISLATVAKAGPVADVLEGALTAQERHGIAADVISLVETRVAGWMIGGLCADGSLEKIEAVEAGKATGHSCCTVPWRNGWKYVEVVDLATIPPWTPSLPETERNSVVRIIAGEVMALPEEGLKGKLAANSAYVREQARPICEAAIEEEGRRGAGGQ